MAFFDNVIQKETVLDVLEVIPGAVVSRPSKSFAVQLLRQRIRRNCKTPKECGTATATQAAARRCARLP